MSEIKQAIRDLISLNILILAMYIFTKQSENRILNDINNTFKSNTIEHKNNILLNKDNILLNSFYWNMKSLNNNSKLINRWEY